MDKINKVVKKFRVELERKVSTVETYEIVADSSSDAYRLALRSNHPVAKREGSDLKYYKSCTQISGPSAISLRDLVERLLTEQNFVFGEDDTMIHIEAIDGGLQITTYYDVELDSIVDYLIDEASYGMSEDDVFMAVLDIINDVGSAQTYLYLP
jgi:hypothetical protein